MSAWLATGKVSVIATAGIVETSSLPPASSTGTWPAADPSWDFRTRRSTSIWSASSLSPTEPSRVPSAASTSALVARVSTFASRSSMDWATEPLS